MHTNATNKRLRDLLLDFGEKLIPRPDFQRRLVWTNKDKINFIDTVINGYPFPEIYIAAGDVDTETGKGSELLVDGQQRLTTLYEYFKGKSALKLPKDFPAYKDLHVDTKKAFLEYTVVVRDLGSLSIDEVKSIFQRINSTSYSLNPMEIHNARYDGHLKRFAEQLSRNPFFEDNNVFTSTNIKRMHDVVFCLNVIITMLSTYFNRNSEIDTYLEKYNEYFPEENEIRERFLSTINFIENLNFESDSRAWKRADIFTLICEVDRLLHKRKASIESGSAAAQIKHFYMNVNEVRNVSSPDNIHEQYYKAALQATNDRKNRIVRGEIIQSIIDSSYEPEIDILDRDEVQSFDEMRESILQWFSERYCDPVECCPYESKEGGYFYLWGGPYDARDVIFGNLYDQYPDEVMESVVSELEDQSWEWSGNPHYNE